MIEIRDGDRIRFNCTFTHEGAAFSGANLHCAIGLKRSIWPHDFDEKVVKNSPALSFPADPDPESYTQVVTTDTIKVGGLGGIPEGVYEAYVKLTNIPGIGTDLYWYGPDDDIRIVGVGEAVFDNLEVSYTKA